MSAPGSLSALREAAFDNLQLNVGVFLKSFDYESIANAGALRTAVVAEIAAGTNLLGVTTGGGSFSVTREMRNPQIDGLRYRYKGGTYVDSADPYLATTLKEMTPGNFANAIGGVATTSGKKTTVRMPTAIPDSAYLGNLCWVGELASGEMVLICLYNALNVADFTFTFQDKNEGSYGVEFHGCQSSVLEYDYAPFEVVFFETDGSLDSVTVSSAVGSSTGSTAITTDHTLGSGEKYVYKIGNTTSAPSIDFHEIPDYTWTEWDGSSQIAVGTSANNKKATFAVLNGNSKAIMSGSCTLTVKTN